ncbi:MAG: SPFH domain-containing protein [Propionibacteriaceae bacterium]|jgi:regulator of protease activity HflC (stomatin/prohibitin superfamily)|nr:SPFH domain-containing protein [Propionibacteriaceae bacterium]
MSNLIPPTSIPSPAVAVKERVAASVNGLYAIIFCLAAWGVAIWLFAVSGDELLPLLVGLLLFLLTCLILTSFTIISPGDTKVICFFGKYVGTVRRDGLRLTYPLTLKRRVSIKVRNFETHELKVNDSTGNPINIAAIIVWQVADTAQSTFAVEDYEQFVKVQSEAALRHIATIHPYDNGHEGEPTLRGATDLVAEELAGEVRARIAIAGLRVIETRISSLAFAPEIAQAMLQRQQADALLAARSRIVEGAVTMVESALTHLQDNDIVQLDEERKAAMVSNLLVVLCSDSRATPVVNAGSLYT